MAPPPVPETLLKKRKRDEDSIALRAAGAHQEGEGGRPRKKREREFKRAEVFVKEYRAKETDLRRLKQQATMLVDSRFGVPEAKLLFAIRMRGIPPKMHRLSKEALELLRLSQMHTGVFLKNSVGNTKLLRLVAPYITYGYPSVKYVRNLVYKRGFCNVNEGRTPLTNNDVVEEALGEYNMICIEDLVHEISTMGPNFNHATQFLWPFKMKPPPLHGLEGKLRRKTRGDMGDVEDRINKIIKNMT